MALINYAYILVVFLVADSMQSSFLPCAGKPAPLSVSITGCTSLPCNFKRGTDVEARVTFKAAQNSKTLKPDVDVELGKIHQKYPLPQQNACRDLDKSECPLNKGDTVTYKLKMPIEKFYPKVSLTIQLNLIGEHSESQACIRIPSKIVD
ncbi:NPC intracellular cholesterol transporter 2 homolog a-like [Osmia bicornis bicornis]|uniref:NPC intracellular cholesterol transporter 2 homolog a-like n=1 Tax=Osmia bicornis bicornis TaxID=1437191 RepID=UPI0010F9B03C|nr:NPC intracellular cholesterol transporter 2 homolog a-like [Osmia bicornis bicornis]